MADSVEHDGRLNDAINYHTLALHTHSKWRRPGRLWILMRVDDEMRAQVHWDIAARACPLLDAGQERFWREGRFQDGDAYYYANTVHPGPPFASEQRSCEPASCGCSTIGSIATADTTETNCPRTTRVECCKAHRRCTGGIRQQKGRNCVLTTARTSGRCIGSWHRGPQIVSNEQR